MTALFEYDETRYTYGLDTEPCAVCGKPVNIRKPYWAVEYDDQGFYAVGPECRKKVPGAERMEPLPARA